MPPEPPPKPPNAHPPKPPPKPLHEHPVPPHERARQDRWGRIAKSVLIATVIAFAIGAALYFFQISINVILPVLAPIWVGITTLAFTELSRH